MPVLHARRRGSCGACATASAAGCASRFRHFPLDEIHPDARRAAEASEAAAAQGAVLGDARRALRGARRGSRSTTSCARRGRSPASTSRALRAEVEQGAHAARVERDLASGRAAGVPGTPTFFVNGVRHTGAFDAQGLIAALEGREEAA